MTSLETAFERHLAGGIAGVWAALPAELRNGWPVPPVFGENVTVKEPSPPSPFVALEFPGGALAPATIGDAGNNEWRDVGAFMVHVFVPRGIGAELARQLGDRIADHFLGADLDGRRCTERMPAQSGPRMGGNWWGRSFSLAYSATELR